MKNTLTAVVLLAGFALLAPAGSAVAQTGGVRGRVVDTDEGPVADAQVLLEFQGGVNRRYEIETGKDGRYIHAGLSPGPYRITASKEGYQAGVIEVRVRAGGANNVPNIVLAPVQLADDVAALQAKFAEALELAEADKLDEAEAVFKEIRDVRPDIAEVHENLAYVYLEKQDWASAEASCLAALELRPGSSQLMTALAMIYQESGQTEKAVELLSQMEGTDAADGRALFNQGIVFLNAGNSQEAQAAFEAALAAEPPVAEAHYHLGTILVGQGKVQEAVEHFEAYLASNPPDGPNKESAMGLVEALKQ
jgi:tetratricopeptide (TPR) repeat protein